MTILISSADFLDLLSCFCAEYAYVHAFFADSGNLVPFHEHYDYLDVYFDGWLLD